jgi:hypothetical protein
MSPDTKWTKSISTWKAKGGSPVSGSVGERGGRETERVRLIASRLRFLKLAKGWGCAFAGFAGGSWNAKGTRSLRMEKNMPLSGRGKHHGGACAGKGRRRARPEWPGQVRGKKVPPGRTRTHSAPGKPPLGDGCCRFLTPFFSSLPLGTRNRRGRLPRRFRARVTTGGASDLPFCTRGVTVRTLGVRCHACRIMGRTFGMGNHACDSTVRLSGVPNHARDSLGRASGVGNHARDFF